MIINTTQPKLRNLLDEENKRREVDLQRRCTTYCT